MSEWTIWANDACSKSRGAEQLLAEHGVEVRKVRYLDEPPTRAELEAVLRRLGTDDPAVLLRRGEPEAAGVDVTDREAVLDALTTHPRLLERPVVQRGERAVVARPPERVLELLQGD